jgi:uncharacterized protein (UPF0261 family)
MSAKPKVLMIVTLDTKELEAKYLRKCLEDNGLEVYHMDASIRRTLNGGAAVKPEDIAAAVGKTMPEIRALNHEGKCTAIMTEGAIQCAHALHKKVGFSGIIGAGGSLATNLATGVMRSFPFGLPKFMISTMASGMVQPFVGTKDVIMMYSVCDFAGLNAITRRVMENGALAIAGMARAYEPFQMPPKPTVALSTLGTTEFSSAAVRKALEEKGFEVMIFHTQGNGGRAMDDFVRDQDVSVVVNLSTIEIGDYLVNGLFNGGPDRCKASLEKGVPTIFVPGNIDFMVGGPLEEAKVQFPGKRYHVHNAQLTAVRAEAEEFKRVADHMAGLMRLAKGPVIFFIPMLGFSNHDSKQGHLYDPSLPPVFAEHLKKVMPAGVPIETLPYHINDGPFAERIIEQVIAFQQASASRVGLTG